jgi:hypothetical protein
LKIANAKKDKYQFQSVKKKAIMIPVTNLQRQIPMLDQAAGGSTRSTENFTVKRRYLTEREVERLIEAAKTNRNGHRDATMVLLAFRHALRGRSLTS